jgi:single-stranded-DNA-specific exonuclease
MTKRWNFLPINQSLVQQLAKELEIPTAIATVLVQRGVSTEEEARKFFRPSLYDLHSPFLMADMEKASSKLEAAISQKDPILLYGDYDVDGITSVAMMFAFLRPMTPMVDYYIPDRFIEGYGLSSKGIEYAAKRGVKLLITLDCGIRSNELIEEALSKGIETIICDHHMPGPVLPPAFAILDPKRCECSYPFKDLSGCGVGFKLLTALTEKMGLPYEKLNRLLDLVALSSVCDLVPLTGENRILTSHGLQMLNKDTRPGLRALFSQTDIEVPLEVRDLVFGIGPYINAAGRMGDAKDAVKLLLTPDKYVAKDLARILVNKNTQRKELDKSLSEDVYATYDPENKPSAFILWSENWHKGVLGIAAARLVEKSHRPAFIIAITDTETAVGSARSIEGFDIFLALETCKELLINYGGHSHAAGFTMHPSKIEEFKERIMKMAESALSEEHKVPEIDIAAKLSVEEISPKFWRALRQLAPFGPNNMNPIFLGENTQNHWPPHTIKEKHLRLKLSNIHGETITGIGFHLANLEPLASDDGYDLVYNIQETSHHGKTEIQVAIKDIKPKSQ